MLNYFIGRYKHPARAFALAAPHRLKFSASGGRCTASDTDGTTGLVVRGGRGRAVWMLAPSLLVGHRAAESRDLGRRVGSFASQTCQGWTTRTIPRNSSAQRPVGRGHPTTTSLARSCRPRRLRPATPISGRRRSRPDDDRRPNDPAPGGSFGPGWKAEAPILEHCKQPSHWQRSEVQSSCRPPNYAKPPSC